MTQRGNSVALKPSAQRVLNRLRQGPATTHDLLADGCGSRFGARIAELRNAGFQVSAERLPLPTHGSRYRLLGEPERALSATQDPSRFEQADPGSVPSLEGVRSAAPAESHDGSLFDSSVFAQRGDYRDVA